MTSKEVFEQIPKGHRLTMHYHKDGIRYIIGYGVYNDSFFLTYQQVEDMDLEELGSRLDACRQHIEENREAIQKNLDHGEDEESN